MKKNIELLMAKQFAELTVVNLDAVMKDDSLTDKEFNSIREAHDSIASARDTIVRLTKPQRMVSAEAKENGYGESEDEKIRKKLIHLVNKSNEYGGYALHKWEADEMLAWLEKQGEQTSFYPEQNLSNEVGNYDHSKVFQSLYNKPTSWSEEDGKNYKRLMDEIVCLGNSRNSANRLYYNELIEFIKKLKNKIINGQDS